MLSYPFQNFKNDVEYLITKHNEYLGEIGDKLKESYLNFGTTLKEIYNTDENGLKSFIPLGRIQEPFRITPYLLINLYSNLERTLFVYFRHINIRNEIKFIPDLFVRIKELNKILHNFSLANELNSYIDNWTPPEVDNWNVSDLDEVNRLQKEFNSNYDQIYHYLIILYNLGWNNLSNLNNDQKLAFFEVITLRIKYEMDGNFSYNSLSRKRESFQPDHFKAIWTIFSQNGVKKVLDLYANTCFTAIMNILEPKEKLILNDSCLIEEECIFNEFKHNRSILENKFDFNSLTNGNFLHSTDYKELESKYLKQEFSLDKIFLPISDVHVSFWSVILFAGIPQKQIIYLDNIDKRSIFIDQNTRDSDFGQEKFDFVIIDSPFAYASDRMVKKKEAIELFTLSINLANSLVDEGYIFLRIPNSWKKLDIIPKRWISICKMPKNYSISYIFEVIR